MPIVDSERLPKEDAGRGLTSTLRPRNLEKETQHDGRAKYSENLTGQAGQTTREIGNSLAGSGRRRVGLKSHRPSRAWARDLKISRAGPGAGWAGRGRPRPARPHLRELAPPAKNVGFEIFWGVFN